MECLGLHLMKSKIFNYCRYWFLKMKLPNSGCIGFEVLENFDSKIQ